MDLDTAKANDQGTWNWVRLGMFASFAAAVGILVCSLVMPATAKATPSEATLHRPA